MIDALSDYIRDVAKLLSKNSVRSYTLEDDVRTLIDFEKALAEVVLQMLIESM